MFKSFPLHLGWMCLWFGMLAPAHAASNVVYATSFSAAQGYDWRYELAGQKSWVKDISSDGGNGIITNWLGSYAAYVGLFELQPATESISLWPTNIPVLPTNTVVWFSTRLAVIDSSVTNWDDFFWSVYNRNGDRLFTLDFDNYALTVNYLLDQGDWADTGVSFANDVEYTLKIRMDLPANQWSAWLNNTLLATNKPITTQNYSRDIADIDAVWAVYYPNWPGDNFMVFDDYTVAVETNAPAPAPARLVPQGRTPNGQFLLRVYGPDGSRQAVEASTNLVQWTALNTNVVFSSYFDFIDSNSPNTRRFYRARYVP